MKESNQVAIQRLTQTQVKSIEIGKNGLPYPLTGNREE